MNPTEQLRTLLDERGVEYTTNDEKSVKETCWPYMGELIAAFAEYDNGTTCFACDTWCFTPQQAIAATLSDSDATTTRQPDAGMCRIESRLFWDAEMCEEPHYEYEMQCGGGFNWIDGEPPKFCPNCGRRVVDE